MHAVCNSVSSEASNPCKKFVTDGIGFVELVEVFGNDLTVVNAARVSFNKESGFELVELEQEDGSLIKTQRVAERDEKLIHYLAKHKHVTPFFHPQLRLRIKMPIFVVREWYRHSIGFARNEVSRRYITSAPECFVPAVLRETDANLKQGSKKNPVSNNDTLAGEMRRYCDEAVVYYNNLLEQGVCPEQARMILPQSMYTEFIETGSLSAYARLVGLRVEATAQREIQDYAQLVSDLIKPHFPVSWDALCKYQ